MSYKIVYLYTRKAIKWNKPFSETANANNETYGFGIEFVIPGDARMAGIEDTKVVE